MVKSFDRLTHAAALRDMLTYHSCASSVGIQKEICEYIIELRYTVTNADHTAVMFARKEVRSLISCQSQASLLYSDSKVSFSS